jgi:hypothetical protein
MVAFTPESEFVIGFALQLIETPLGSVPSVRYTAWIPPLIVATVDTAQLHDD